MVSGLNLEDYIGTEKWLLDNGLVTAIFKNDIFVYGTIAHEKITAVEADIAIESKKISYNLYFPKEVYKVYCKYLLLKDKTDIFSLWRLNRLIKKHGVFKMEDRLRKNIFDRCGKGWEVKVNILPFSLYKETPENETKGDIDV